MASYRGVIGVLQALEDFFKRRLPDEFQGGGVTANVRLLGSADVARPINGNVLGIYLHRVTVDSHGRNRHFPPTGANAEARAPELAVNLHIFLLAAASSANIEANLISWAMLELANEVQLDISHLAESDSGWNERESVTVTPEEVSTEDLFRIWDVFEAKYTITVPYVIRTVRLRLRPPLSQGPAVITRAFPAGAQ